MVRIHTSDISPPLVNASCAWSSDFGQLQELYNSPYTGAVTTRTATLDGFQEDASHAVHCGFPTNSDHILKSVFRPGRVYHANNLHLELLWILALSSLNVPIVDRADIHVRREISTEALYHQYHSL